MAHFQYQSKELEAYINALEDKYLIVNAAEKYHNLVNFSQNNAVPYHQWFKYREGFAAELIQGLLKMADINANETVIDPFCGSGTTNVVAAFSGYNTLGLDVNPMSAFITNAKVDSYDMSDLLLAEEMLLRLSRKASDDVSNKFEDIRKYFSENNFKQLLTIREYIDSLEQSKSKNILFVGFLSTILPSSNRKRDGNGLKTVESKVKNVFEYYTNQVELIINDIRTNSKHDSVKGLGIYGSAFDMHEVYSEHFGEQGAGAIIFSPPYANSFDYFESYKLELVFSGYVNGVSELSCLRKKAVRSFVGAQKQSSCDQYVDLIGEEIANAIPGKEAETGKKDSRTRKVPDMLRGYFSDMHEVIRQCSLCLEKGKRAYIVVDQSSYLGTVVPTDLLFSSYAEQEGFKVEKIIECRKARTSTQQLIKYPQLKNILRESIVELVKE